MNLLELYTLGFGRGLLVAVLLLVATATLDAITTSELSLAAIYLFPILIATWNCGPRWGAAFALASCLNQFLLGVVQGHPQSTLFYFAMVNVNRTITYLLFVYLANQLRRLYDDERDAARLDDLTGVRNRRGFREVMQHEIYRHARSGLPFCVAYLDCDHFKAVNDQRGHAAGDDLLRAIARSLCQQVRRSDTVGRVGGDEFAIIFPETEGANLLNVVAKLRTELAVVVRPFGEVTFSTGVVTFPVPPDTADRAIQLADRVMYRAKSSGRDGTMWDVFEAEATPRREAAEADA